MYDEFLQKIDKLYEDDRKKLRTGTILYGNLYEDRWQTHMATGTFFAYNRDGLILQLDMRSFKPLDTYQTLTGLLEAVYEEGERLVFNNEYLDFE